MKEADGSKSSNPDENWLVEGPRTLDPFNRRLTLSKSRMQCRNITLTGHRLSDPSVSGPGHITFGDNGEQAFFVHGKATDNRAFLKKFGRARANPYDALEQFRFEATDYDGINWNGGWVAPQLPSGLKSDWPLSGDIEVLTTEARGDHVAENSGVELFFETDFSLPFSQRYETTTVLGSKLALKSWQGGQHLLTCFGTPVLFRSDIDGNGLWITAPTNAALAHPFLENWLAEPLRILLGQNIYPFLVARNFGDGSALVQRRRYPKVGQRTEMALYHPHVPGHTAAEFWNRYRTLLEYIATEQEFEATPLAQVYQQINEVWHSSNWVRSLTLASAVEILAKPIKEAAPPKPRYAKTAVAEMKKLIKSATDADLRHKMLTMLGQTQDIGMLNFLRELAAQGKLFPDSVEVWRQVRNAVMHGDLVAPWATQEGDIKLGALIRLVHDLTLLRIDQSKQDP